MEKVKGFAPYYNGDSKVLILGSFPSVKSREQRFYYGNGRNAFWRILATFFSETAPLTLDEKKDFLSRRKIALWDVVSECEIVASRDETIKNFKIADVKNLLQNAPIEYILINGGKAYEIFIKHFSSLSVPYEKVPSTSPANARRNDEDWYGALRRAFSRA
ncbi:MAG: DNA-deoxyinosine glycosylase [Candidatus Coproplasma sp.]